MPMLSRPAFPSLARRRFALTAALAVAFAAFGAGSRVNADPATRPADAEAKHSVTATKYLRLAEASDDVAKQLQTSVVHFEDKDGVRVDLIGAVHIADRAYFDELNKRFKAYDAVLYEMVKPKEMQGVDLKGRPASMIANMQRFMQEQLQLDFQLDRIDYSPNNFVHADLDAETFQQRQAERGESMLSIMLNQMMREMSRAADDVAQQDATPAMGIMDLIQALQSPDRARQLKLVLAKQFSTTDDIMAGMGGDQGSVILDDRNKHALEVLRKEIDGGKKHLAIFYGAAHLRGMEEMMTGLMGFKQIGEPEWLCAWDLTDAKHLPARPLPAAITPGSPTPADLHAPATQPSH